MTNERAPNRRLNLPPFLRISIPAIMKAKFDSAYQGRAISAALAASQYWIVGELRKYSMLL